MSKPDWIDRLLPAMRAAGLGVRLDTEVARALGVSREAVRQVRMRAGLARPAQPRRRPAGIATENAVRLAFLRDPEARAPAVARDIGRSLNTIQRHMRRLGLPPQARMPRHTEAEIVAALRECGSVAGAAARLGYARQTMHNMLAPNQTSGRHALRLRAKYPDLPRYRRRT